MVNIVAKAHKRALAIHRSFVSGDVHLLVRAYKTYVRPVIEHNSVIYHLLPFVILRRLSVFSGASLKATWIPKSSIH